MRTIFQHHLFDGKTYDFDISILLLEKPLQMGSSVRRISLATSGTNIITGMTGYATGWGLTDPKGHVPSDHLKYVVLPSISKENCNVYYPGNITSRMFCAGYAAGGKDTCQVKLPRTNISTNKVQSNHYSSCSKLFHFNITIIKYSNL